MHGNTVSHVLRCVDTSMLSFATIPLKKISIIHRSMCVLFFLCAFGYGVFLWIVAYALSRVCRGNCLVTRFNLPSALVLTLLFTLFIVNRCCLLSSLLCVNDFLMNYHCFLS